MSRERTQNLPGGFLDRGRFEFEYGVERGLIRIREAFPYSISARRYFELAEARARELSGVEMAEIILIM